MNTNCMLCCACITYLIQWTLKFRLSAGGRWGIDASDPRWGDGHYYDYTGDCLDTRVYPRSKFVSEFGFQSYPSFSALKNVTVPEDWSYTSAMMNYR